MLVKLSINQISICLFEIMITSYETNYEEQFKISQIFNY